MDVKHGASQIKNTLPRSKRSKNKALCLLSFSDSPMSPFHHTVDIYKKYKLLKFADLVTLKNLFFIHDYINKKIPESFDGYFHLSREMHTHNTRNASQSHLFVPQTDSVRYGRNSFKLKPIFSWNSFCEKFPDTDLTHLLRIKFKNTIISHYLESYTHVDPPKTAQKKQ